MAQPTLGAVTLTGVESISTNKTANIIPLPLPTGDSDETEVFDLLGVVKTITLVGVFAESTISATKTKVDDIEALVDGNQTTVNFVSDQTGTISVMIADISTSWDLPGNRCNYNIKLIQGR